MVRCMLELKKEPTRLTGTVFNMLESYGSDADSRFKNGQPLMISV